MGGRADFNRIDPDRLGDVLELGRAEIGDREIEPPLDLTIGVLGEAIAPGSAIPSSRAAMLTPSPMASDGVSPCLDVSNLCPSKSLSTLDFPSNSIPC